MTPHASAARSTPAARCGLRRFGCASRRPHGSVLRTLLRCYPGVSSPGLVGPAGVEPASAGFLCSRAQTVRPMKCPSVRAVKRLSALSHNGRRVSPSQGGTDNRHVDQTHRGGAGGCRTRTFAALAQPRAFRRRSFPDELPAPCSARSTPLARCGLRPYAGLSPLKGDDLHVPT